MEDSAATAAAPASHKRVQRSASGLLDRDQAAKRQEKQESSPADSGASPLLAPLLPHLPGESKCVECIQPAMGPSCLGAPPWRSCLLETRSKHRCGGCKSANSMATSSGCRDRAAGAPCAHPPPIVRPSPAPPTAAPQGRLLRSPGPPPAPRLLLPRALVRRRRPLHLQAARAQRRRCVALRCRPCPPMHAGMLCIPAGPANRLPSRSRPSCPPPSKQARPRRRCWPAPGRSSIT